MKGNDALMFLFNKKKVGNKICCCTLLNGIELGVQFRSTFNVQVQRLHFQRRSRDLTCCYMYTLLNGLELGFQFRSTTCKSEGYISKVDYAIQPSKTATNILN